MSEFKKPVCPICKQEVLLPFSILQVGGNIPEKTYGTWICSNCGFFLSTRDKKGKNPESDVEAGFSVYLQKKVEDLRQEYYKKSST